MLTSNHRRIEIVNALGLHLRAASQFVRVAQRFQAEVSVHSDGKSVNGKSILDLTTLAAAYGTWLDLEASGLDADKALAALSALIEARFHES
jgi:phosphocarrier protein HPr